MVKQSNKIQFDIEMVDYDEMDDMTHVRVSRSDNNAEIAKLRIWWKDDGTMSADIQEATSIIATPDHLIENMIEAVKSELDVHQAANENIVTLRDLFAVVTPSGECRAIAVGFA